MRGHPSRGLEGWCAGPFKCVARPADMVESGRVNYNRLPRSVQWSGLVGGGKDYCL